MANIYLTSDDHFWHNNILKPEYDNRPFDTVEEMNKALIQNWNDTVSDNDTVINLGDMFMGRIEYIDEIMPQLNYKRMIYVKGNHCIKNRLKKIGTYHDISIVDNYDFKFPSFLSSKSCVHFYCAHKPNDSYFDSVNWNDIHNVRLYGHTHSGSPHGLQYGYKKTDDSFGPDDMPGYSFHVGVDTNGYKPVCIDKIYEEVINDWLFHYLF